MIGLCTHSTFDSEAAMRLESLVVGGVEDHYPFETDKTISCAAMMDAIARDLAHKDLAVISTMFHNTLARIIADVAMGIRNETGINKVVLSGGVFQNCYLLERALLLLSDHRFFTYTQQLVPANDGGISLGQLIVASNKDKICA
jgi:hydrogenase maturation protein HypF